MNLSGAENFLMSYLSIYFDK